MKDELGTRMKEQYETRTRYFLPRRTYTIIRLDGKAFHTFTRGMEKPYDLGLVLAMNNVSLFLCKEIQGVKLAFTQSDEISLLLTDFETITTEAWFNGNIQKIASVSSSLCTAKFNEEIINHIVAPKGLAFFDARVFSIPDPIEVENYFIWRQKDAIRNSISITAQSLYSHNKLNRKSQSDMLDMIEKKGQNWNTMASWFRYGRTIGKRPYDGEWVIDAIDFIKDREILQGLIPKYE